MNGVSETQPSRREETDHQPRNHQTTLPQGREMNGKPGPGSRAILRHLPQAIASSTFRKDGVRGKHTWNVVNDTGERKRGREESSNRCKVNRPEERTSLQDSASNAHYRYCGGRATPKLKEEQPDGKSHSSSPSIDLGVTKTPKEKGKTGGKLPSRRSN